MKLKLWDVIKYEGPNNLLVWKHPAEDFNTSSTLIVHESQEAVFFKNGQIADILSAGRYTLKTENLPILRRILNLPTGGVSSFHCEVYFINTTEIMSLKWGTNGKVQFIEPTYNFPMEIGASGEMSLKISDCGIFLVRLVGTEKELTPENLVRYFRSLMMTRVKSYLARFIKENNLNIFEIDSQLDILSDAMKAQLVSDFAAYGIDLIQFFVSTVVRPEDDPAYIRLREATQNRYTDIFEEQTRQQVKLIRQQTEAQMRIMEAQSLAEKRRLEGYTYQDERSFDVAQQIAENEGTDQFSNLGMGFGMMAGIGTAMGGAVGNMVGKAMGSVTQTNQNQETGQTDARQISLGISSGKEASQAPHVCKKCGAALQPGARFCHVCGAQQPQVCPNCGHTVAPNSNFCPFCGQKQ